MLTLGSTGFAQRNVDPDTAVFGPPRFARRGDELEGDFDALGLLGRRAHLLDLTRGELRGRRLIQAQWKHSQIRVVPGQRPVLPRELGAVRAKVVQAEAR